MPRDVEVPPPFVELMQEAVELIDSDDEDERSLVDMDDGIENEHGAGGRRSDGRFAFEYFPVERDERWTVVLGEEAVRAIAAGGLATMPVEVSALPVRPAAAKPLALALGAAKPAAKSRGRAMLDALVAAKLVSLHARAKVDEMARVLEESAIEVIDHPAASDEQKAASIVETLLDLPGIDDVYGEDLEVYRVVLRHAE